MTGDVQHVVGYGWRDGAVELRLFDGPARVLRGAISLGGTDTRRCVGWWDREHGIRRACQRPLAAKSPQCQECSQLEGFWKCMTCDGFRCPPLSPAIHDYCRADHALYLACFGSERVKIGTSIATRKQARLVEQGPVAAMHIAQAPGPVIKQMEALGVSYGLSEHMTRRQKWSAWRASCHPAQAMLRLQDALKTYVARLPEAYQRHLHPPSYLEFPPSLASTEQISHATLTPLTAGTTVRGTVHAARGHIALLYDGAGLIGIDLGSLKGRLVDFAPAGGQTPVRQLGLFD